MKISELQKASFEQAEKAGWHERPVLVPEQVALICSEACEALESWRNGDAMSYSIRVRPTVYGESGEPSHANFEVDKPMGVGSEYADVLIRIADYAQQLGIDLEAEVVRKLEYNKTRPYRHGGKLA